MQRIPLRQKIFFLLLIIPIVIVGISLLQLQRLNGTIELTDDIINNDVKRLAILHETYYTVNKTVLAYGDVTLTDQAALTQIDDAKHLLAAQQAEFNKHIEEHAGHDQDENVASTQVFKLGEEVLSLVSVQSRTNLQVPTVMTNLRAFEANMATVVEATQATITEERRKASEAANAFLVLLVVTNTSLLIIVVVVGFLITSMLRRALQPLLKSNERLALGDFSRRIPITTNDEIGRLAASYNTMSERLRDSYARLGLEKERDEAILQRMSEGLVALDPKGRIVLCNPIARNILSIDMPIEKLLNRPFEKSLTFYNEKNKPLPYAKTPIALSLKKAKFQEGLVVIHRDSLQSLVHVSANPIIVDKVVSGVVVLLRDITKEHEIDRMKTEFISLASHQLRTPLSAIKWFSDMLVEGDAGKLNPQQLDFAKNVAASAERMIELVNSLLNISRIESGRIIVDPAPTDLKALIDGIVSDLSAKSAERQQNLIVSVHPDLPKISVDPKLIGQVYLNLFSNAIKYTPKGGEISVFVSRKGGDVISSVTDNGYGIPQKEQGRIFDKFFRAENVSRIETDGTGLGLYLIKAIVESSGGKIWFESEENKGTTFWFTIPLSGMKAKEGDVTLDIMH